MMITVSQDHIDNGVPGSMTHCMVVNALRAVCAPGLRILATRMCISIGTHEVGDSRNAILDTPPAVASRMFLFDNRASVAPFWFDLDIPEEFLRKTELFDVADPLNVFIPEVIVFDERTLA